MQNSRNTIRLETKLFYIFGRHFGNISSPSSSAKLKYGPGSNVGIYTGKNCEVIVKNQVAKCTTEVAKAGYKRDGFSAYIRIMDQSSPTELLNISFRTPTYVQVSPTILNVMNLTNITLSGNNFGPKGSSIELSTEGQSKP